MCLSPRWIYKTGRYLRDNYRGTEGSFYEIGTFSQCGCCEQCIATKSNNWVVRNHYEAMANPKKCFITLTYKENPIIIVRKDIQDFMKRLRIELDKQNIKVRIFYCMEYGTINNRPHAHVIIYGWEDPDARYLSINKKGNVIYQSDLIERTWKLGRTSYQRFSEKEAPYIALYATPQETFKRAYKINFDNLKKLETYARNKKNLSKGQRKNLILELMDLRKQLEENKKKYVISREINGWSIALGWEAFEKQYYQAKEYVFMEYIQECQIPTPSPWVKKLANEGDIAAAKEMYRREEEADKETDEQKEIYKNTLKLLTQRKREMKEWIDEKDVEESF